MKRTRVNYTEEQIQFIKDLNDKCYNQEIIDKFYEKFGVQLTLPRLTHIKNVRGIKRKEKKYRSNSCLYRDGKKEFLEDLYFKGASHKEMIEKYKELELDLLDFDAQKRKKVKKARQHLFYTIEYLKIMQENKDSLYTIDKAIEDIKWCFDELEDVEHKYDYDKLPKDI